MSDTESTSATSDHDPVAFAEKLRAWRREGMTVFTYGGRRGIGSKTDFHEQPSVKARENAHVAEMKEAGVPFERKV